MTENTNTTKGRKPTHIANVTRDHGDGKTEWLKIGVAWAGTNGGFVAQLHAAPVDGRIVFTPAAKP